MQCPIRLIPHRSILFLWLGPAKFYQRTRRTGCDHRNVERMVQMWAKTRSLCCLILFADLSNGGYAPISCVVLPNAAQFEFVDIKLGTVL